MKKLSMFLGGAVLIGLIAYGGYRAWTPSVAADHVKVEFEIYDGCCRLFLQGSDDRDEREISPLRQVSLKKGLYRYRMELEQDRKKLGEVAVLSDGKILMK